MTETTKPKTFNKKVDRVFFGWLCVDYPNLFNVKAPKPLAIGVGEVLQQNLPKHISIADYKAVIGWYCQKKRYLRATIEQQYRYDLNGEIAAEITEEDKIRAKERLEQKAQKSAEKQQKEKPVETALRTRACSRNRSA